MKQAGRLARAGDESEGRRIYAKEGETAMSELIGIDEECGALIMRNMEAALTAHEERLRRVFEQAMTPELALELLEAGAKLERSARCAER